MFKGIGVVFMERNELANFLGSILTQLDGFVSSFGSYYLPGIDTYLEFVVNWNILPVRL